MQLFQINRIGYHVQDPVGFTIDRPNGCGDYLFIHFMSSVDIGLRGGAVHTESPDCCVLLTPSSPHWYQTSNDKLKHHWIHFSGDAVEELLDRLQMPTNELFVPADPTAITVLMKELITEYLHKDLYWEEAVDALLLQLFTKLARSLRKERSQQANPYQAATLEKFRQIRGEMLARVEEPWSVKELAEWAGLSESRFAVLYRDLFNSTPKGDLITARIEKAKYLLTNSSVSIKQVSVMLGYTNEFHFQRQFKERVGCTPGQFALRWVDTYSIKGHTSLPPG